MIKVTKQLCTLHINTVVFDIPDYLMLKVNKQIQLGVQAFWNHQELDQNMFKELPRYVRLSKIYFKTYKMEYMLHI